jgi:D-amino-acid dehydrogenase
MPDSVPVIGPAAKLPGLWLAVGHGHLGLTDSVNTAERIADGLLGPTTSLSPSGELSCA